MCVCAWQVQQGLRESLASHDPWRLECALALAAEARVGGALAEDAKALLTAQVRAGGRAGSCTGAYQAQVGGHNSLKKTRAVVAVKR